jgi:hypothetical protein
MEYLSRSIGGERQNGRPNPMIIFSLMIGAGIFGFEFRYDRGESAQPRGGIVQVFNKCSNIILTPACA